MFFQLETVIFTPIPLDGPVHRSVSDDERGSDVEHLVPEASPGVEDGGVEGTRHGSLAVSGQGVGDDALLRGGAACYHSS